MSFMFEVYYKAPADAKIEDEISAVVEDLGGSLDYRETIRGASTDSVCLTFEFNALDSAQTAATLLRQRGKHVEGPVSYGP